MKSSRSQTCFPSATYIADFTGALVDFLRRQLNEIVLPLTHHAQFGISSRPGMSLKGRARNVLAEDAGRKRVLEKWEYSLSLTVNLLQEDLVDRTIWAERILDWLQNCHPAQFGWILGILGESALQDVYRIRWMAKQLVVIIMSRLAELETDGGTPGDDGLISNARNSCRDLLRDIFRRDPDALLLPKLWSDGAKKDALMDILLSTTKPRGEDDGSARVWIMLEARIDRLLCLTGNDSFDSSVTDNPPKDDKDSSLMYQSISTKPCQHFAYSPAVAHLVNLLDSVSPLDSVRTLSSRFFSYQAPSSLQQNLFAKVIAATATPVCSTVPLDTRIMLLLEWAVTPARFGSHRKYLVIQLLSLFLEMAPPRSEQGSPKDPAQQVGEDRGTRYEVVQRCLLNLLDAAKDEVMLESVRTANMLELICELCDAQIFDLGRFLQSMIARGTSLDSSIQEEASIHVRLLRELPLRQQPLSLSYQLLKFLPQEIQSDSARRVRHAKEQIGNQLRPILGPETVHDPFQVNGYSSYMGSDECVQTDEDTCNSESLEILSYKERREVYREWLLSHLLQQIKTTSNRLAALLALKLSG